MRSCFRYFCALHLLFFLGCSKPPVVSQDEGSAVYKDVKGMVFNACTDSGIAGIKVYLEVFQKSKIYRKYETVSGFNGAYTFTGAELNSSPDFTYDIFIPSKSGENAEDQESCGIRGTSMTFDLKDADEFMKLVVVPKFIYLNMYFIKEKPGTASDSIIARFTQNIYHKNVPDYPYKFGDGLTGISSGAYPKRIGNYPMGPYSIAVHKWVNDVHTHWKDSIYIRYGDTAAYVLRW